MDLDTSPDRLLAEPLRRTWVVLPRRSVTRIFWVSLALGMGAGLTLAGVLVDRVRRVDGDWLLLGLPLALIGTRVAGIFLPSDEPLLQELGRAHPETLGDAELLAPGSAAKWEADRAAGRAVWRATWAVIVGAVALAFALFDAASNGALGAMSAVALFSGGEALIASRRHGGRAVFRRASLGIGLTVAAIAVQGLC